MKKIFILGLILTVISGCSAEYTIEITEEEVKENLTLFYDDSIEYETDSEASMEDYFDGFQKSDYPIYSTVEYNSEGKYPTGTKFYDKNIVAPNEIEFYTNTDISQLYRSRLVATCTNDLRITKEDNYYSIIDYNGLECIKDLSLLEEVVINIVTDIKVLTNNADVVDGNTYTWKFNKNDNEKSIEFIYSDEKQRPTDDSVDDNITTDDTKDNSPEINPSEETTNIFLVLAVIGVFIFAIVAIIIIKKKKL